MCIYIYIHIYFLFFKVIQNKLDEQIRPFTLPFRRVSLYIYMILTHVVTLTNVTTMLITMKMDMKMINNKMMN